VTAVLHFAICFYITDVRLFNSATDIVNLIFFTILLAKLLKIFDIYKYFGENEETDALFEHND